MTDNATRIWHAFKLLIIGVACIHQRHLGYVSLVLNLAGQHENGNELWADSGNNNRFGASSLYLPKRYRNCENGFSDVSIWSKMCPDEFVGILESPGAPQPPKHATQTNGRTHFNTNPTQDNVFLVGVESGEVGSAREYARCFPKEDMLNRVHAHLVGALWMI